MTGETLTPLDEAALGWLIRLRDADADDWAAFETWLDGDAARAEAYWRLAGADADVGEALAAQRPSADLIAFPHRPRRRFRLLPVLAPLAASLALVFGGYWLLRATPGERSSFAIVTRRGEHRTMALADGTAVALNGDTRLTIDRDNPRAVQLDRGEARFEVHHDAARPFVVRLGNAEVRDLGTVFDVVRDEAGVRVTVAQGMVAYTEHDSRYRLGTGTGLFRDRDGTIRPIRVAAADVAAWREHRLVYDRASFDTIARDLTRTTGAVVSVDPRIAARRFSGGIRLGSDRDETIARAAAVMGVTARKDRTGWRLAAR